MTDETFLEAMTGSSWAARWMMSGRKIRMRHFELGQSRDSMVQARWGQSEFRLRYHGYHDVSDPEVVVPGEENLNEGLKTIGTERDFVEACYVLSSAGHLTRWRRVLRLAARAAWRYAREDLYALLQSQEFADRYRFCARRAAAHSGGRAALRARQPGEVGQPGVRGRVLDELRLPAEKNWRCTGRPTSSPKRHGA